MEFEFLKSLVIIFGVSAFVVFVLGRLKIPSIAGFLIAGIILGPYSFEFIKDVHEIELLAEIGVILLMFTIGLEFSLKNFLMLRSQVLGGGFFQVSLTVGIIATLSYLFFQQGINNAIFNGFLVSLSSTAIVMKMLFDSAEMNTPHGRMSVGILIFQDLCVVPFMLLGYPLPSVPFSQALSYLNQSMRLRQYQIYCLLRRALPDSFLSQLGCC